MRSSVNAATLDHRSPGGSQGDAESHAAASVSRHAREGNEAADATDVLCEGGCQDCPGQTERECVVRQTLPATGVAKRFGSTAVGRNCKMPESGSSPATWHTKQPLANTGIAASSSVGSWMWISIRSTIIEVAPVSWSPQHLGFRRLQWERRSGPTRPSLGSG